MRQAYILVYKVGVSLADVHKMTLKERNYFLEFLKEDIEAQNDSIKRSGLS